MPYIQQTFMLDCLTELSWWLPLHTRKPALCTGVAFSRRPHRSVQGYDSPGAVFQLHDAVQQSQKALQEYRARVSVREAKHLPASKTVEDIAGMSRDRRANRARSARQTIASEAVRARYGKPRMEKVRAATGSDLPQEPWEIVIEIAHSTDAETVSESEMNAYMVSLQDVSGRRMHVGGREGVQALNAAGSIQEKGWGGLGKDISVCGPARRSRIGFSLASWTPIGVYETAGDTTVYGLVCTSSGTAAKVRGGAKHMRHVQVARGAASMIMMLLPYKGKKRIPMVHVLTVYTLEKTSAFQPYGFNTLVPLFVDASVRCSSTVSEDYGMEAAEAAREIAYAVYQLVKAVKKEVPLGDVPEGFWASVNRSVPFLADDYAVGFDVVTYDASIKQFFGPAEFGVRFKTPVDVLI